ncbi:MAG: threonine--tRNA ligase [Chloroflexota bacterium]|nr:MAG: threonine--tRNA ligase [Chloroflexota bacterium]
MADLDAMRHSASHVMAEAVQSLIPNSRLGIGPAIEEGFYYDFELPRPLAPDDLAQIEARMAEIKVRNSEFVCQELSKDEARALFSDQPYKLELIAELPDEKVSIYRQGDWYDLCRGPHVHSTGEIGEFKLLSIAGAYWRGDEKRPMLQRIYGTTFPDKQGLETYLHKLEEAERRDHRRLGKELDLFSIQEDAGPGLIFWHPKGAMIRYLIENFWKEEHLKRGYQLVYSPHIARADLWKTSGHWGWYRENMYAPMEIEGAPYLIKPMNCPFHILIYKSRLRSYRELPFRWAELGTVYRYERSGTLHGMLRVRGFTQDDAHIFCRPDQLEAEVAKALDFAIFLLQTFGFREFNVELSVRDPQNRTKYLGSDEIWDRAEGALSSALERRGQPYHRAEGEAVFYGPKIDIKLIDALGRPWQGPTIQVDFNMPEKFDLNYVSEDGSEKRVIMVHRAMLGSLERFMGCLIEHYAGAFPVWLAPVQATIIPIADRHLDYAQKVNDQLTEAGLRVEVDSRPERMNQKIRQAQLNKIPYMLVVGDKEGADGTVAVRVRSGENLGPMPVAELQSLIERQVRAKE